MRSMNESLETSGIGYWSGVAKPVNCIGLDVPYIEDLEDDETPPQFGELRVYFETASWKVEEDGLIYADKGFIVELQNYLLRAGYDPSDIGYSEQGMQGDNYVSLDVGPKFLSTWINS